MANSLKDYQRAWYLANLEKAKAARHNYYLRNKERIIFRSIENHRRNRDHYNELARERRKKNPEAARRACRKWAAAHHEQELERCRKKGRIAYWKDPQKFVSINKAYHEANGDRIRAQQRDYYKRNTEKRNAANREYHKAKNATDPIFRLKHALRGKATYQANKERIQARHKEWLKTHPGVMRAYAQRRRAMKKAVTVKPESIAEWMQRIRSKPSAVCHYCGKRISSKGIHFDHIKALAKGGEHRIENLCVSCPKCNLTKGAAALNEWCKQGQQMLALFI